MTEQGEEVEMANRGVRNKDDHSERKAFERSLREDLKEGDVDNITDKLTPRALTKCDTNALLMAMEVNFELRRLAEKKGPDEEDFTKLANSVDEFTSCLLDPLKSNTEDLHAFGNSLDYLLDAGIELEQKKFFAHPVMYNLMRKKWFGPFGKMKRSSWLEVGPWKWFFLNIWCLFDIVLFPFLFTLFYIKHRINKVTRRSKEIDLAFVITATSDVADEAFKLMKRIIINLMCKFKNSQVKYHILVHGEDSSSREICFTNEPCDFTSLFNKVDQLTRNAEVNIPALHENLKKIGEAFTLSKGKRPNSEKALVLLTDQKICLRQDKKDVEEEVKKVKEMGVNILPVGMGPHIDIRELEGINRDGHKIMHFGEYANPKTVGNSIFNALQGKDLVESYREYFTTPYFVFIRDTLSYLTLLGLHIALCLETSSIPFSSLEWAILVFFLGRILMESRQFLDVKIQRKSQSATRILGGSKYQICGETEEEKRMSSTKAATLLKRCNKYLSDRWNILDFITLLNYLVTFVLRVVTWTLSESVTDNRALVIAGYLYGLNTMFLTLRAFGHVMETAKGIGAIQIALFHIIGDIATIFWQFVAAILAFSIAITKVYMAERSFISNKNATKSACESSSGLACWWSMMKHLTWSLLGVAELDPLDSVDSASVTLVHFLFGAFLIMGVILLVNMMIALLSNTYQRVEDNSLKEWSFKKAITIQTYSTYHPIPVPLNLLSHFILWIKWLCHKCRRCKRNPGNSPWTGNNHNKSLDDVVEKLHLTYFSSYGYSFPLTDERKMDHVLQETERNRQMANQIAYRTFAAKGVDDDAFPTGPKAWQSQGIRIQGCLLTCEGSEFCSKCKYDPGKYHGARYKFPFSPDSPHFEVLVQETGERRLLGVGVVGKDYGNHAMPGWFNGTVGYHIDDGRIFDAENPTRGKEYEDAMAHRGDLIGCTVRFDLAKDGKVPVVFSLNGRQVTRNEISMDYTHNEKFLYPYIGMGHQGLRVLAKMSSHGDARNDLKISESGELRREKLESILKTLTAMDDKYTASFGGVKDDIKKVNDKIDKRILKSHAFGDKILSNFKKLEEKIILFIHGPGRGESPKGDELHACTVSNAVLRKDIAYLCQLDNTENPTNDELLEAIKTKMEQFETTMDEKINEVSKALQETKERSQLHGNVQEQLEQRVEKRFREHEEFIRTNLLKTEELELILSSLQGIKEKLISPCCGINSAIRGVEEEIDKAHDRFSRFAEEICINFSNLEERIIDGIEERKLSLKLSPPAEEAVYLLSIEEALPESVIYMIEAGLAIVKIRAKIKEKIGQIEKMIDEKFNEVAKAIEETEKKSQKHGDEEDELRKNVQKRFREHEDFLRTKLLKL